jgi:large subunit ribosomal protein L35
MKTRRGAAKRFSVTGSGKVRYNKSKRRHILTKKSTAIKRVGRKGGLIAEQEVAQVRRMIPYKF